MAIVKWDPLRELMDVRSSIDKFFESSFERALTEDGGVAAWAPKADVLEKEDAFVVNLEVPGINPDDVQISLQGDTLSIRGERKHEAQQSGENYLRVERSYGAFQRNFALGLPVEADKVSAEYADGVLTVTLPKAEAVKPKQIRVKKK